MPQPMPNEILEGIKSAFETRYPARTVTRNWQDRACLLYTSPSPRD